MSPLELCEHLGGHELANKLRAEVNGKMTVIARRVGDDYELTEAGKTISAKSNAEVAVGLGLPEEPALEPDPEPEPEPDDE